jgi:hypothetical protein
MIIKCPICETLPQAEDIDLKKGIGLCRACNLGFNIKQSRYRGTPLTANIPSDDFIMRKEKNDLVIEHYWRNWTDIPVLLIMLIISGVVFYADRGIRIQTSIVVFILTYILMAKMFNKTQIRITANRIKVTLGPIWWLGSSEIESRRISQFYVMEYIPFAYRRGRNSISKFSVCYIADGSHGTLVDGFEYGTAKRIEAILEGKYEIEDRAVARESILMDFSS